MSIKTLGQPFTTPSIYAQARVFRLAAEKGFKVVWMGRVLMSSSEDIMALNPQELPMVFEGMIGCVTAMGVITLEVLCD